MRFLSLRMALSLLLLLLSCSAALGAPADTTYDTFVARVAQLEAAVGGRLGVAMLRTRDGTWYSHRGDERFPLCSVFKVVAVAQLLKRSESEPDLLATRLPVTEEEIMPFSYVIRHYLKKGITLGEVGRACLLVSDNTAANILLRELGGPAAVTAFARTLGDTAFRIDRWEMDMNDSTPGDERDTTTPLAMARTLQTLVLGDALAPQQRDALKKGMVDSLTGERRLRAGAPRSWTVAQKTGTGDYGTTNAVGVLWPPVGWPLVLVVFYTKDGPDAVREAAPNSELLAAVARLATQPQLPLVLPETFETEELPAESSVESPTEPPAEPAP